MNQSAKIELFSDAFLSGDVAAGAVERVVSRAVRPSAAKVVMYGVVQQLAGASARLSLQLEGSYDGSRWITLGSVLLISGPPAVGNTTVLATDCAYVRVRAEVTGNGSPAPLVRFDAGLVFSTP